ncbi:MAG: hypothetical protein V4642_02735 [Bacteroidota bacterium]
MKTAIISFIAIFLITACDDTTSPLEKKPLELKYISTYREPNGPQTYILELRNTQNSDDVWFGGWGDSLPKFETQYRLDTGWTITDYREDGFSLSTAARIKNLPNVFKVLVHNGTTHLPWKAGIILYTKDPIEWGPNPEYQKSILWSDEIPAVK